MNQDEQHLKLLSIFHYVLGGIACIFSCFPVIHLIAGIFIVIGCSQSTSGNAPPAFIGFFFIAIALFIILSGWAVALCILIAGRKIEKRKSWLYCMIIAGIECLFMPFGTVLGVFTIIVLARDSVKQLFMTAPTETKTNLS